MSLFFRWTGQPWEGRGGSPWTLGQKDQRSAPGEVAGLGRRAAARLLDILIIAVPASFALRGLASFIGIEGSADQAYWFSDAGVAILLFAYFAWFEWQDGSTFAKKLLGTRVVNDSGGTLSFGAAAKRNAWLLVGVVPGLGGLLLLGVVLIIIAGIARNPTCAGYHDRIAGTFVILAAPTHPSADAA